MVCFMKGSHLRVASCLLLPAIQLVVGISHPSWVSLPFFIGSCVGLVDWSLTSNFLGLFRWLPHDSLYTTDQCSISLSLSMNLFLPFVNTFSSLCSGTFFSRLWKALQLYAGFNIVLLYVYQLPMEFSNMLQRIADFVGLFKISSTSEWPEICSAVSLVLFYILVCTSCITIDLVLFKDSSWTFKWSAKHSSLFLES